MAVSNSMNMDEAGLQTYSTTTGNLTGSTTTQYNVIVGDTNNKVTNVAPSATSGVPLVSGGASANPSYTTAVVAGGGTGVTSNTAYAVLTGGTTSTNPVQSIASVGTSGQVLTSNGAGALPTFQSASGGFSPNSTIQMFDDFIGAQSDGISNFPWTMTASWTGAPGSTSDHLGVLGTPSITTNNSIVMQQVNSGGVILGGGVITLNFVFKINAASDVTNRYILMVGFGDVGTTADQTNGCYVKYSDNLNSGNWQFITALAAARTTSSSSTPATAAWHNVTITINAAASSVSFLMDGVSLGTAIATNIPTAKISPRIVIERTAGTIAANSIQVDLFYMTQTLTTPR